jgi:hypothetical protein
MAPMQVTSGCIRDWERVVRRLHTCLGSCRRNYVTMRTGDTVEKTTLTKEKGFDEQHNDFD